MSLDADVRDQEKKMIVLSASNLTKAYGTDVIIKDADFHINSGDRIGLIGRNGAGKTTLLNMMTAALAPDEGHVFVPSDLRIGYLRQRDTFREDMTVIEAIESIFEPLRDMEKQIMKAADQAAAHPEDERLLHRLDSLQQEYDRKGGYTYKSEMNGILTSMAFGPEYQMCIRDRSLPMPKDFFRSSVIMTSPPD